jgi:hypothetical protein
MSFSAMVCDWCVGVIYDHENYEVRDGYRICHMCLCEEENDQDEEEEEQKEAS